MKYLQIKAVFMQDGISKTSEALVPYKFGASYQLPKIYPFDQNIYFGPDDGAFLGDISIDKEGRINYLADTIKLKEGATEYSPFKNKKYVFFFEVIEKDN